MKVCPKCGLSFDNRAQSCRKCKIELLDAPEPYAEQADAQKRRKDWIWILIGTPLFILFLRFVYNIINK